MQAGDGEQVTVINNQVKWMKEREEPGESVTPGYHPNSNLYFAQ